MAAMKNVSEKCKGVWILYVPTVSERLFEYNV